MNPENTPCTGDTARATMVALAVVGPANAVADKANKLTATETTRGPALCAPAGTDPPRRAPLRSISITPVRSMAA